MDKTLLGEASAALQKCDSNRSLSRQAADARRGAADRSEYRQTAGAFAEGLIATVQFFERIAVSVQGPPAASRRLGR